MSEQLYRRVKCYVCDGSGVVVPGPVVGYTRMGRPIVAERGVCSNCRKGHVYEPVSPCTEHRWVTEVNKCFVGAGEDMWWITHEVLGPDEEYWVDQEHVFCATCGVKASVTSKATS